MCKEQIIWYSSDTLIEISVYSNVALRYSHENYNVPRSQSTIGRNHVSFSCITGISSKKNIFEGQAFSNENKKDFILNALETYQFLAMLHKNTVNWRNIWDFWSSLKT